MSRSGYSDNYDIDSRESQWALIRWRGAVMSAIRGKRGQTFLRELLAALDALPEKKLVRGELATPSGEVCAIGSVMKQRGLDTSSVATDDYKGIASLLGINSKLVQEIEWENDEIGWPSVEGADERRFRNMRQWVLSHLKDSPATSEKV